MCHSFGPLEGGRANTTVFGVLSFAIFGTPDQQRERRNQHCNRFLGCKMKRMSGGRFEHSKNHCCTFTFCAFMLPLVSTFRDFRLFAAPYDPPGGVASGFVCKSVRARAHTSARADKPRDAGLSPSAGTSLLKRSAGARRA
eukprot:scaffold5475_cov50-Phaeocystis_antarctica.AAC.1